MSFEEYSENSKVVKTNIVISVEMELLKSFVYFFQARKWNLSEYRRSFHISEVCPATYVASYFLSAFELL